MRTKLTLFILMLCALGSAYSQSTLSVEESIISLQAGLFGGWISYEKQLKPTTTLKAEIGLDNGVWSNGSNTGFYFVPAFIAEPRWYYGLKKRIAKEKDVSGNSANYLSLFLRHHPDWFILSNENIGRVTPDLSIIPTWGIHRKLSSHFSFETSVGIGYRLYFVENTTSSSNYGEMDFNLTVRIGYDF